MEGGILTFELDNRRFAVELRFVREVLPAGAVTPVPGAPAVVRGLVNARGTLATAIDVGPMHGLAARTPRAGDPVVLLELPPQPWSDGQPARTALLVDRVLEIGDSVAEGAVQLDVPTLVAQVRRAVESAAKGTRA